MRKATRKQTFAALALCIGMTAFQMSRTNPSLRPAGVNAVQVQAVVEKEQLSSNAVVASR